MAVHVCEISHVRLCDPLDYSLPGSSVHFIIKKKKKQALPKRIIGIIPSDYLDLIFLISLRVYDNFSLGFPDTRFKSVHWLSQDRGTFSHCSLQSPRGSSVRHLLYGFNITPSTQVHTSCPDLLLHHMCQAWDSGPASPRPGIHPCGKGGVERESTTGEDSRSCLLYQ